MLRLGMMPVRAQGVFSIERWGTRWAKSAALFHPRYSIASRISSRVTIAKVVA